MGEKWSSADLVELSDEWKEQAVADHNWWTKHGARFGMELRGFSRRDTAQFKVMGKRRLSL